MSEIKLEKLKIKELKPYKMFMRRFEGIKIKIKDQRTKQQSLNL